MKKPRRLRALLWFLFWIAFFSLAFTPAHWVADALLLAVLVTAFIVFNVAKVQKLWKYRSDPKMREAYASGQGGIFNSDRLRRWALDDHDDDKKHRD